VSTRLEIRASATNRDLLACLETIGHFGVAENIAPDVIGRVRVVVEELFSNTIKYGYGGECDRPVWVNLSLSPVVTLRFEDEAPPFDPTRRRAAVSPPRPPSTRREGGAGLALVFGLAATVVYQALDGGNRLVVTFAPEPEPSGRDKSTG
jgi:anti-sigma regulatory factor (Ser/Thr protein kinase)